MGKPTFVKADEIATDLEVSVAYAYKIIQRMNRELKSKGYMVISGRVSRLYYEEHFYGIRGSDKGEQHGCVQR